MKSSKKCPYCGKTISKAALQCKSCSNARRPIKEETRLKLQQHKHTEETKKKLSAGKLNSNNPMWKGDKVGYLSLHEWVHKYIDKKTICAVCGETKKLDLANISGTYKRDLTDWEFLCRRCHMIKDGRMERFNKKNITRRGNVSN